jgi:eukaryotic-like serine/threonine-protein kinase
VLAVGLGPIAFLYLRERPPAPEAPVRFQIPAPEHTTLGARLNLSPDGRKLAFVEGDRLWVHFLESGESRELTAAEGTPFWSADSRFIAYSAQGKLKKIEATGGPLQIVADLSGSWGSGAWNRDGVIVFGVFPGGLFEVPANGGVPVPITAIDPARQEQAHYCSSFLPDGRHFVYNRSSVDQGKDAIYLGSVDSKPEQQSSKPLLASNWGPVYAPSADPRIGYLLFMREGALMSQPFDNRQLTLTGQAASVAEEVGDNGGAGSVGAFSASANDVLVFWRSAASDRLLTWYDREGKVLGTTGEPGDYQQLALSPDGSRLAVSKKSGKAANIWLLDLARGGTSTRFTFGSALDESLVWSPDGSQIIFSSNREGSFNLYQKLANGVKDAEVLLKSSEAKYASSWSRDGRSLLYQAANLKGKYDTWVLPMKGDKKPVPFLITEFNEVEALFSPDGQWVAYTSDESGHLEVYVRSFSMNSAGTAVEAGGKWQISDGYGFRPAWRGDGRELYYHSRNGVMAVEIATNPVFRAKKPRPLGTLLRSFGRYNPWDSTTDGKRFLAPAPKSGPEPYTVVLNWQAGLKK